MKDVYSLIIGVASQVNEQGANISRNAVTLEGQVAARTARPAAHAA